MLRRRRKTATLSVLASQFTSPIVLILLFAAVLSLFLHDPTDAVIILVIVLASGLLGFWQERGAANAVDKLLAIVGVKATVLRDGKAARSRSRRSCPATSSSLGRRGSIPADCLHPRVHAISSSTRRP